jgi:hypothetical protein
VRLLARVSYARFTDRQDEWLARISHQLATASANCTSSRGVLALHSST